MSERDIGCFFTKELLFLYVEGTLEAERKKQIEEHFKKCTACAELCKRYLGAKKVLSNLTSIQPKDELVAFLQREQKFWSEFFENYGWSKWPTSAKWATELAMVSIGLVLIVNFFPWLNVVRSIQLWKVATSQVQLQQKTLPSPTVTPDALIAVVTEAEKKNETEIDALKPSPTLAPVAATKTSTKPSPSPAAVIAKTTPKPEPAAPKGNTGVWRGVLIVSALEETFAKQVTDMIAKDGGERAGKVELGWRRDEGFYYHFLYPKQKFEAFRDKLKEFGELNLKFDAHPRVIRDDQVRVIISVETAEVTNESDGP